MMRCSGATGPWCHERRPVRQGSTAARPGAGAGCRHGRGPPPPARPRRGRRRGREVARLRRVRRDHAAGRGAGGDRHGGEAAVVALPFRSPPGRWRTCATIRTRAVATNWATTDLHSRGPTGHGRGFGCPRRPPATARTHGQHEGAGEVPQQPLSARRHRTGRPGRAVPAEPSRDPTPPRSPRTRRGPRPRPGRPATAPGCVRPP